jgi:hypothetical protein
MQPDLCNELVASEARASGSFAGPRSAPMASVCTIKKVVTTVEEYAECEWLPGQDSQKGWLYAGGNDSSGKESDTGRRGCRLLCIFVCIAPISKSRVFLLQ